MKTLKELIKNGTIINSEFILVKNIKTCKNKYI